VRTACFCAAYVQNQEDVRTLNCHVHEVLTSRADDVQTASCRDTAHQQASHDESRSGRELCQCVMSKAHSLNEVSSRNCDPAADVARISLDAETGPAANRRRRKRYSPSRGSAQTVSINSDDGATIFVEISWYWRVRAGYWQEGCAAMPSFSGHCWKNKGWCQCVITFCVSRRRRKMYCGHAPLSVCLSVCLRPYAHTTARTRM